MKKKLFSSIMLLLLAFMFSFSACGINGNDAANDSGGTSNGNPWTDATDRDKNNENSDSTLSTDIITDATDRDKNNENSDSTLSTDIITDVTDRNENNENNDSTLSTDIITDATDRNENNENNDSALFTDIITDWESVGIFTVNVPDYEFDFSIKDTEYTYETGSAEDEALFASILSGKKNYKNYFDWFCANPSYIYRFNEECYKAVAETIREGAFTQQLRDKYFGLVVTDTNYSYLGALGIETESYQIFFKEDWSIKYIKKSIQYNVRCNAFEMWHYSLIGYSIGKDFSAELNGEIVQYDRIIEPNYEEHRLIGYRITQDSLLLSVNMGNGKTADCCVDGTYRFELDTEFVWNGQKQQHEQVTFLSCCKITADFNNVYSGGYEMFDRILIYAKQSGLWNPFRVWEQFREEVLTPSLNRYETNEQKIYRLA